MDPSNQSEAGVLLDQLLESLLADFDHWFKRGDELKLAESIKRLLSDMATSEVDET